MILELIFEELDYQETPLGSISLRRRNEPRLDNTLIYEVKLGEEFLMSSLFVEAEEQLSILALASLAKQGHTSELKVVVGGLGLGYTALAALNNSAIKLLRTIDIMQPVISWHEQGLIPIGNVLATDPRSKLIHGDFFAIAGDKSTLGFVNDDKVHAVLLDIDHSPSHWLNQSNESFYSRDSLQTLANKILAGGVFGLWSNEAEDPTFKSLLATVFARVESHTIEFANPYSGGNSINTVYIAVCA